MPSLALHDTMRYLKSDVGTIGFGACMGMSGFLLATGTKGKRAVLPNTRVMLHHPSGVARGQAADIDNEARGALVCRLVFYSFFLSFFLSSRSVWFPAFFSSECFHCDEKEQLERGRKKSASGGSCRSQKRRGKRLGERRKKKPPKTHQPRTKKKPENLQNSSACATTSTPSSATRPGSPWPRSSATSTATSTSAPRRPSSTA